MHQPDKVADAQVPDHSPTVSELFINLSDIFSHRSENDCRIAIYNLRKDHAAIPRVAVDLLVTSIWEMVPNWRHNVVEAVGPLLLSITQHRDFTTEHANAITDCATKFFQSVVYKRDAKPGQIAQFAKFGDILARTLSMCEWSDQDATGFLSLVDDIVDSPDANDRLVGVKILQGLAQSPKSAEFAEESLLPRLGEVISEGEDVILGDVVFAYACAIKHANRHVRMRTLWSEVRTLWYDSGLEERRDRRLAVSSLCEMFRKDNHVFELFSDEGLRVGEFLTHVCEFAIEECEAMGRNGRWGDPTFVRCVADELASLVKFMTASGNTEVRRKGVVMFSTLQSCKDDAVAKACKRKLASFQSLLEQDVKKDRQEVVGWKKFRLVNLWNWGRGQGKDNPARQMIDLLGKIRRMRLPCFGKACQ